MTHIGKLRHRITIQTKTRTKTDTGGYEETWSDLASCWAEVVPGSGREMLSADQKSHRVTHRITIRARSDVRPFMRVSFDNRLMDILGVVELEERGRWTQLSCEENAPA